MQKVLADAVVSVAELKRNPAAVMASSDVQPIAVLSQNRVMAYLVSAQFYEILMDELDDLSLARKVRSRANEQGLPLTLDDL